MKKLIEGAVSFLVRIYSSVFATLLVLKVYGQTDPSLSLMIFLVWLPVFLTIFMILVVGVLYVVTEALGVND